MKTVFRIVAASALFASFQPLAQASCGSAFCAVNTNWETQGVATKPGWRFDLRFEFIDQDQPRAGHDDVAVGEISAHHDEVRTLNRNTLLTVDRSFEGGWGISTTVPIIDRDHQHIHHHHGAQLTEAWNFTALGDIRVVGRRHWSGASLQAPTYGVLFGLKLPSGAHHESNADGDLAERTLQPGSGTTDALLGLFYNSRSPSGAWSWFAQAMVQTALDEKDDFKPGERVTLDLGASLPVTERVSALLQINTLWQDQDKGAEAEPDDSGRRSVSLSPGLALATSPDSQLYLFAQFPLYEYVRGVQLTADNALLAGWSTRF